MKKLARQIVLILLLSVTPAMMSAQAAQEEIRIGLIPEMNVFKQMERFKPLARYLSEKSGVKVKFTILSRYGNIIDSFARKELDGAFFGSFTGALAIRKVGAIPLARPVNLDGKSTYHGYIYTRKDSGIKSIADMQGKKFAFVEKATTAGYIFPLAYLQEQGVTDLDSFFSEYFYAGSHDASLYAVLNKKADIGASKNTVYDWIRKADPRIDAEIVILAESSKVPSNGLCVRKDLKIAIRQKLKSLLLNLDGSPEGRAVLQKMKAVKFIETTVDDYRPVISLAEKAGIDLRRYEYRNE
jgi:phosphonate transport system substrate-binding protein